MLLDDGGEIQGEFAVNVGEGARHLTDVLEDDVVRSDKDRK